MDVAAADLRVAGRVEIPPCSHDGGHECHDHQEDVSLATCPKRHVRTHLLRRLRRIAGHVEPRDRLDGVPVADSWLLASSCSANCRIVGAWLCATSPKAFATCCPAGVRSITVARRSGPVNSLVRVTSPSASSRSWSRDIPPLVRPVIRSSLRGRAGPPVARVQITSTSALPVTGIRPCCSLIASVIRRPKSPRSMRVCSPGSAAPSVTRRRRFNRARPSRSRNRKGSASERRLDAAAAEIQQDEPRDHEVGDPTDPER